MNHNEALDVRIDHLEKGHESLEKKVTEMRKDITGLKVIVARYGVINGLLSSVSIGLVVWLLRSALSQ